LLAPNDEHMTIVASGEQLYVRLAHGPRENNCRPAIDPLFRSAAAICGPRTIGVVLTGFLDDGTVGLQAVKARGGISIVQDPTEAEAPDMPTSALRHVDVDLKLCIGRIGPALIKLTDPTTKSTTGEVDHQQPRATDWVDIENRIIGRDSDMKDLDTIGTPSSLTCPECSGALWEIRRRGPLRYRCHTGHAFTAEVLERLQGSEVENAIWGAVRALHEQERLYIKMYEKAEQLNHIDSSAEYLSKAQQARKHSQSLRAIITARTLAVE
jgi:two-component system chemotaxis response regulator CheB